MESKIYLFSFEILLYFANIVKKRITKYLSKNNQKKKKKNFIKKSSL